MIVKSERFKLVKEDLVRVGKGALLAGGGVFLTVLIQGLLEVDLGGVVGPSLAGLIAIFLNFVLKLISSNSYYVK